MTINGIDLGQSTPESAMAAGHKQTNFNAKDDFIENFLNNMEALYEDFNRRIEAYNWMNLLNSSYIRKSTTSEDALGEAVLCFLIDHSNLPLEILQMINRHFQWFSPNGLAILKSYAKHSQYEEGVKYIQGLLALERDLSLDYILKAGNVDLEAYLSYRQKAYLAVTEQRLMDYIAYIEKAKEIFADDPELLCIEGSCLATCNEKDKALKVFSSILDMFPCHEWTLLQRGWLYFELKQYKQSAEDLSKIKTHDSIFHEVPSMLGYCYFNLKDYENSRIYFNEAYRLKPTDAKIKTHLLRVDKALKKQLTFSLLKAPFNSELRKERNALKKEIKKIELGYEASSFGRLALIGVILLLVIGKVAFSIAMSPSEEEKQLKAPLKPGEMRIFLTNPMAYSALHRDKEYQDEMKLKILQRLPVTATMYSYEGYLSADVDSNEADGKSSRNTAAYNDVYLCQYGNRKTLIVLKESTKSNDDTILLTCRATVRQLNKEYFLSKVQAAMKKSNIDAKNLITTQYLEVEVNDAQLWLMDLYKELEE